MTPPLPQPQKHLSKALVLLLAEIIVAGAVLSIVDNKLRDSLLITVTAIVFLTAGYWLAGLRLRGKRPVSAGDTSENLSGCSNVLILASDFIRQETEEIEQETTRVKTLVTDASRQLAESFHSLAEQTRLSNDLAMEVLERSHQTFADSSQQNEQSFIDETAGALDQFIQILVMVSKQSLKTVYEIDDMVKHVDSIFALLDDVRHIADQTNFLSLNAAIEAARAGDAGRGFSVVAAEIRNLSNHSNELNGRIREQIENTKQAIANVRATVGDMAARDMTTAIHTKDRLNKTFEDIAAFNAFIAGHISLLSRTTAQINNAVGDSIRSLQFEDIVTQSLGQAEHHLKSLHEFSTNAAAAAAMETSTADIKALCRELHDRLTELAAQRKTHRAKIVEQQSMQEGDIDLF
jgi:methyl-accepting chemotaxis protein